MVKFIILTTQRTGSTLLWKYLNGHPKIEGHGELFLPSHKSLDTYAMYKNQSYKRLFLHYISRKKNIEEYMNNLFDKKKQVECIGFKLMYSQLFSELENWIINNHVSVIHLVRKNILKMIVSRITAKKRNLYHVNEGETIPTIRIKLNPKKLIKNIKRISYEVNIYRKIFHGLPYIEITYENFVSNREKCSKDLSKFLGIDYIENLSIPSLTKINPESIEKLIINYEEIVKVMRGTKYEKYLIL